MDASAMPHPTASSPREHGIPFGEAVRVWAKIAALSFGGPAGQIAVMHRILVEEKRWIGEARFLHALNYCMLLPGPEAQQLAIYIGWLLHRTKGGLIAGVLFVLPGFLAIMALSWVYALLGNVRVVEGLFFGLKAAVLGVLSRNRRKFRQPINVACPAPGRWGRPNSRVTSRHFDHGNASRTSRPDCSGLDEAD